MNKTGRSTTGNPSVDMLHLPFFPLSFFELKMKLLDVAASLYLART